MRSVLFIVYLVTVLLSLLLLLLSHFSRVQLYATPWTAAHQASPIPRILMQRHDSMCGSVVE